MKKMDTVASVQQIKFSMTTNLWNLQNLKVHNKHQIKPVFQ